MFPANHLSVTVVSARNLRSKGKNGTNDAFVIIQLGTTKFKTSMQQKTIEPRWEEECEFFFDDKYIELILTVNHRNSLTFDEFLGQLRLPLDEIYEATSAGQRPRNRWFPLKSKLNKADKEQKYRGELQIRLLFSQKTPPSPAVISKATSKDKLTSGLSSLKKLSVSGSMPSLSASMPTVAPGSPTLSIRSNKKKSLLSKLRPSTSFVQRPRSYIERDNQQISSNYLTADGSRRSSVSSSLEPVEEQVHAETSETPTASGESAAVENGFARRNSRRFNGNRRPVSLYATASEFENGHDNIPEIATTITSTSSKSRLLDSSAPANFSSNAMDIQNDTRTKQELINVINDQRALIGVQRQRIDELQGYIDVLLLKVMNSKPEILDSSMESSFGNASFQSTCKKRPFRLSLK